MAAQEQLPEERAALGFAQSLQTLNAFGVRVSGLGFGFRILGSARQGEDFRAKAPNPKPFCTFMVLRVQGSSGEVPQFFSAFRVEGAGGFKALGFRV